MRTIVIGDIHGCLSELKLLLGKIQLRLSDRVVFLGDFLDKGPDGPATVRFVRQNGWESTTANHEELALRWLKHYDRLAAWGCDNPGLTVQRHPMKSPPSMYESWKELLPEDITWLKSLPNYIDLGGGTVAVHAGFMPGVPFSEQHPNDMIRLRWVDPITNKSVPLERSVDGLQVPPGCSWWMELWDGAHGVIYGHAVHSLEIPRVDIRPGGPRAWLYGIDTGGVHGGRLTALILNDEKSAPEIIQVPVPIEYCKYGSRSPTR